MDVKDAGKKGGSTTKARYGDVFYTEIGKRSATTGKKRAEQLFLYVAYFIDNPARHDEFIEYVKAKHPDKIQYLD